MSGFLHDLYARLPIIRDLKHIERRLQMQEALLEKLVHSQLARHVEHLLKQPRYADPRALARHERQVFSEYGEDGVIAEIFRRVGVEARTFLEIGVGNGLQNNTAFLLHQGWKGWWVDGNQRAYGQIQQHLRDPIREGRLKTLCHFVTAENVVELLREQAVPPSLDLLSIDIDRNTYWIWKALGQLSARAVVVEYNATMPPDVDWKVDYDPKLQWNRTFHYGASLKAFERLGREQGYQLVGCSLSGVNAFFVRADLCGEKFQSPFTSEEHYEPPRYFLSRREGPPAAFTDRPPGHSG